MPDENAIVAEGLTKLYGGRGAKPGDVKHALDGFDLSVPYGMVYGLLGPNGAGKTTAVKVLSTLVRLDGGQATVAGHDVARAPRLVRRAIGLAGQYAAVDEVLTGRQNLEMFGRLFHLGAGRARTRADELLEHFDLFEAADKGVKEYSGGMRRRLDIAASMLVAPKVMFLDEPTTGLDPRGRNEVWDAVRSLVADGTTVLLTTQYLEEADQLASRIAVIEHGRVIADDTPEALKDTLGGDQVEVITRDLEDLPAAFKAVAAVTATEPETDEENRRVHAPVTNRVSALSQVARSLEDDGVAVEDIGLRRPTLDEVFLQLTGRPAEDEQRQTQEEVVR